MGNRQCFCKRKKGNNRQKDFKKIGMGGEPYLEGEMKPWGSVRGYG